MSEIILVKEGEIAIKGLNKRSFEDAMVRNIRRRLSRLGKFEYDRSQSTVVIRPLSEDVDFDEVEDVVSKVFGIAAYCRALVAEKDFEVIAKSAVEYNREVLETARSFKVNAKMLSSPLKCARPRLISIRAIKRAQAESPSALRVRQWYSFLAASTAPLRLI